MGMMNPMGHSDAVRVWLGEVGKTPLPDEDDTRRLCRLAQAGDADALKEVWASHLRLVWFVVAKLARQTRCWDWDRGEMVSLGCLALRKAVLGFDDSRGIKFNTYAYASMIRVITRDYQIGPIRTPAYTKTKSGMAQRNEATAIKVGAARSVQSLDDPAGYHDAPGKPADGWDDASASWKEPAAPPEDTVGELVLSEEWAEVARALGEIPAREAEVLRMRYGLDGHAPMVLSEVGKALGVSKERVRQLQVKAERRLRGLVRRANHGA